MKTLNGMAKVRSEWLSGGAKTAAEYREVCRAANERRAAAERDAALRYVTEQAARDRELAARFALLAIVVDAE